RGKRALDHARRAGTRIVVLVSARAEAVHAVVRLTPGQRYVERSGAGDDVDTRRLPGLCRRVPGEGVRRRSDDGLHAHVALRVPARVVLPRLEIELRAQADRAGSGLGAEVCVPAAAGE